MLDLRALIPALALTLGCQGGASTPATTDTGAPRDAIADEGLPSATDAAPGRDARPTLDALVEADASSDEGLAALDAHVEDALDASVDPDSAPPPDALIEADSAPPLDAHVEDALDASIEADSAPQDAPCRARLARDEVSLVHLPHDLPGGLAARHAWHDAALLAVSVQGLVNRDAPRLYLDATRHDEDWWLRMNAPGQRLEGVPVVDLEVDDLIPMFRCRLEGAVLWDPAVPATLNVATTVAGVEELVILRFDPDPSSVYSRVMALEDPLEVVVDLRGLFTGAGIIPGTDLPSTGSAKNDAYRWLLAHYVAPGRTDPTRAAYLVDSWWMDHGPAATDFIQVHNRDFFIARRALTFDLSSWGDERPIDDPAQPLGADRATLEALFAALYAQHGGAGFTQVSGFTPWVWKYTDHEGAGGAHAPVETEWDLVRVLSAYNAGLDGDAIAFSTLANASLYAHADLPDRRIPPPAPSPQRLRDLGAWDNALRNPGFDDDGAVGGWRVSLTDYLTLNHAAGAYAGTRYLDARARLDRPPNAVSQDVALDLQPGETARGAIYARAVDGEGEVTLALWGLDGPEQGAQALHLRPQDGWTRLEVDLTPTRAQETVRLEVYLPVGGPGIQLDAASLWVEGRPGGVNPRQYAVWHMGDYDGASGLYQFLREYWESPARGAVPLAWGLMPNLIDRFPLAFHHAWTTATPNDHFSGADTIATYTNITQLYGPRDPSGLPDGRAAFERFARPYLQRAALTHTVFALNGSAGAYDDAARRALRHLAGRGVAFNMAGQPDRTPGLFEGAPFLGQSSDLQRGDVAESLARVARVVEGGGLGFHVFRVVFEDPARVVEVNEQIVEARPEARFTSVEPEALFALIGLAHGQAPSHRLSWIADTLPERAEAGGVLEALVEVRNDGWEAWRAGEGPGAYRLGVELALGEAPEAIPLRGGGYPHRFALDAPVAHGEIVAIPVRLELPEQPGVYSLQLDMVEEGVTWFADRGEIPWRTTIHLE